MTVVNPEMLQKRDSLLNLALRQEEQGNPVMMEKAFNAAANAERAAFGLTDSVKANEEKKAA